jgi:CHASE3 domain sensor protein
MRLWPPPYSSLLLSSCFAYLAFNSMNESQGWVHHTRDVQNALSQFSIATARAGRLRSEYLDSGDASLLQQQAEVVRQIRNAADVIRRLTADNSQQQTNYKKLAELKEQRIALLDQAIELKKTGKSTPTTQTAICRQSLAAADETDQLLRRMYDTEEQLLSERQGRANRSTRSTAEILLTSLFLALVLFILHHRLLVDQVAGRSRAELAQRTLSAKLLSLQDEERRNFANCTIPLDSTWQQPGWLSPRCSESCPATSLCRSALSCWMILLGRRIRSRICCIRRFSTRQV